MSTCECASTSVGPCTGSPQLPVPLTMSLHQKSSMKKPLIAGLSSPFGPPMWLLMIQSVSCEPLRQSQRYSPQGTAPQSQWPTQAPSGFGFDGDGTAGLCVGFVQGGRGFTVRVRCCFDIMRAVRRPG